MAIKKFIDSTGLATLWEKIKALYATKTELDGKANSSHSHSLASSTASGFMSSGDKLKLDGIASGANKYVLPVATSSAIGGVKSGTDITVDSSGAVSVNDNSHNHFYEKGVFYGASGVAGYINFCTITANAPYLNEPFTLDLSSRVRLGTLTIDLGLGASTTITTPTLKWTSDLINAAPVWYKIDSNKLYLYWQKSEAYDEMSVTGLNVGNYTYKGVSFSWGNTYVTATTGLTNVPKSSYKVNCYNFNSGNVSGYTIDSFWVELINYSGCVGSVYLFKKSSGIGSDIVEGWYNFVYMPYGDGVSVSGYRIYGSIILTPMTKSTSSWALRVTNSESTVTEAVKLTKYGISDISGLQAALDGKSSTSHSHGLSTNNFYQLLDNTTTDSGLSMLGVTNSSDFNLVKAVRSLQYAPAWFQPDHSSGIAFGGGDTKGIMSMRYQLPSIRFAGGNGGQFKWNMTISGTSGTTYDLSTLATKTELAGRLNKRGGWCVTNVSTPYWFCIAEYICTTEWFDLNTTFVVSRNFYSQSAIITAKIRHATMGVVEVSELSCISKEGGFPISNLAIAYKGTSGSKSEFQIWAKCDAQYQSMSIMPLYHGTRTLIPNAAEYWTLNQVTHDHTVYRAAVNSDGLFTHPNGFTIKLCTGPEYATKTEALSPYYVTGTDGFYDGYKWDKVISTVKTDTGNSIYKKMFCQGTITNGGYLLIEVLNKGPYTSKSWGIFFISCTNYQSSYYFDVRSVSGNAHLSCYHSGSGNFKLYCEMISSNAGTGFTYSVRILRQSNVSFTWQDVTETPPSEVEISDITNIDTRVTNLEKYKTKGSLLYINSLDDSHVTLNNDGADGVGSITINLSTNKEYYSTIVLDLMSSYSHFIPVKSIKVNADVYSGGESIKLIFEGGPGHLIRSDSSYCFAKIPNSTDDFAAVDSGCYAEVVYYGRIWYTSSY